MELLDRSGTPQSGGADPVPEPVHLAASGLRTGWPGTPAPGGPVDLDLRPGSRTAVVGPSGAGKTTLLMTLAGLLPPIEGTVDIDGTPLREIDADQLRRKVGFFAEDAHLFDTSLLENLRVAHGGLTDEEAVAALEQVGLGDWVRSLPDGVHTTLDAGGRSVSGGQRRRILLARALVSPARVLLLDEPTEHLDADAAARVLHALLDRGGALVDVDRTVVVVTHHLPESLRADRIVTIDRRSDRGHDRSDDTDALR